MRGERLEIIRQRGSTVSALIRSIVAPSVLVPGMSRKTDFSADFGGVHPEPAEGLSLGSRAFPLPERSRRERSAC